MKTEVIFSSKKNDWSTPIEFFKKIESRFGEFDLDPCANKHNAKAKLYFNTKLYTGNYSTVNRAYNFGDSGSLEVKLNGATVVCLVPSRTDTKWWHDYAMKGKIEFIKGRLKFGNAKNNAAFPSSLIIYDNRKPLI